MKVLKFPQEPGILTDEEGVRVLLNSMITHGGKIREEDAEAVFNWAREMKLSGLLLQMALKGELSLSVKDGEVMIGMGAPELSGQIEQRMAKGRTR